MKIYEFYERNTKLKDNVAIKFKDEEITYGELPKYVDSYAAYLQSLGVKKGDKVILSMPNCPEFIFAYLGSAKAGAITIPLNLMYTMEEIQYVVKESSAHTIVVHPVVLKNVDPSAFSKINLKNIIVMDDDTKKKIMEHTNYVPVEINDDEVCTYLYTSGTTGKPKGAMLTHKNFEADVVAMDEISDLGPSDNFLCVLPLFHRFSWAVNVLLAFYLGSTVTIKDSFMPKDTLETLLNEDITVFCGVPSIFAFLIRMVEKGQFKALRLAISGGAPLAPEIQRGFEEKFNFPLVEGYGLSEAAPVAILNPLGINEVRKPGSIGVPLPCNEAKIVDENDNEVPIGEVGELVLKGSNIMIGYHNMPEETEKTLRNGWLHTGDLAKKDEDGYYYIVDRLKDMIILGGFNVYPREVEEALMEHPAVKEAAVIGVGDKYKGEEVKAFIVLEDGKTADRKELQSFLHDKLAKYKIPKIFEFVNELPKSPTGKVMKKLLK
ncbi:AMP-dependent synthetase and ligase [Thermoanaerobacterium thermosaccharolyticum DSM 571]|uniref:AMP-dependent synthetase and ligase n=1 Tax=Thermoanaerobacterium thermosaccharolyticum (strain ATCC 7956 / DSM 571 / NCIMB 9385 / NCA 3814 / NCTC 13789 / WDCM 00135 / 2032) TaxID=580327 RepID=D9TT57_THETC|nr:long-chain fatty acid--CoA ligase [Thermoanaerobacterium thermosaccharolyticum]ADL68199.1 AMP-dependent synthetase and ligase [Thermoanaerobacterium thermosaccharolyticum DSM 571]